MSQATAYPVFTIGHSNHALEVFVALLSEHRIKALADVRSAPYSRLHPHFNRDDIARALKAHRIYYVFLGKELGGRSNDASCYENGRVSYGRIAQTKRFRDGLARLIGGAATQRIALLCAEREPLDCHRTLLVARALDKQCVNVRHILEDGKLETHARTMDRLLAKHNFDPDGDLFTSREDAIATAIERQAKRVAFVNDQPPAKSGSNIQ